MNWRKLEKEFLAFGGVARDVRRNGEREWTHYSVPKPMRFNRRRKDATRAQIVMVKRLREGDDR